MSSEGNLYIVKFTGGFDDIDKLNEDLRNSASTGNSFMKNIIEIATESGITDMDFFGNDQYFSKIGIITQDEGCMDNDGHYCQSTSYYEGLNDTTCSIISKHMLDGSKLVMSFVYDIEQVFYIIENNSYSIIEAEKLF